MMGVRPLLSRPPLGSPPAGPPSAGSPSPKAPPSGPAPAVRAPLGPPPERRAQAALRSLVWPWYNAVLTVAAVAAVAAGGRASLEWALNDARWDVVRRNLRLLLIGSYPADQQWRLWAALGLVGLLAGLTAAVRAGLRRHRTGQRPWAHRARLALGVAWFLSLPAVLALVGSVRTTLWGGLLVTVLLAIGGIAFSFPLGVLLALGRRSRLPAIRLAATLYIELVRGVPLVTILFMAQVLMPLFLPGLPLDRLLRAMVAITAFSAAYTAENIRGGLQGVPRGQYEAAEALGLSPAQVLVLVILPQAIRNVIPAVVGQFISLFKDTSLVTVVGILDLLGIARSIVANPQWLGRQAEVYLFAAAVYWVFTYFMSAASRRLERPETVGRA